MYIGPYFCRYHEWNYRIYRLQVTSTIGTHYLYYNKHAVVNGLIKGETSAISWTIPPKSCRNVWLTRRWTHATLSQSDPSIEETRRCYYYVFLLLSVFNNTLAKIGNMQLIDMWSFKMECYSIYSVFFSFNMSLASLNVSTVECIVLHINTWNSVMCNKLISSSLQARKTFKPELECLSSFTVMSLVYIYLQCTPNKKTIGPNASFLTL